MTCIGILEELPTYIFTQEYTCILLPSRVDCAESRTSKTLKATGLIRDMSLPLIHDARWYLNWASN